MAGTHLCPLDSQVWCWLGLSFQHQILDVPGHRPVLQKLHGSEWGRLQEAEAFSLTRRPLAPLMPGGPCDPGGPCGEERALRSNGGAGKPAVVALRSRHSDLLGEAPSK